MQKGIEEGENKLADLLKKLTHYSKRHSKNHAKACISAGFLT